MCNRFAGHYRSVRPRRAGVCRPTGARVMRGRYAADAGWGCCGRSDLCRESGEVPLLAFDPFHAAERLDQRLEPFFVMAPAADRGGIDRLPDLELIRGGDAAAGQRGAEARIVPIEPGKADYAPDLRFGILHQRLVAHVEDRQVDRLLPELHGFRDLPVALAEERLLEGETIALGEMQEQDRDAAVERIAPHVDDACLGK